MGHLTCGAGPPCGMHNINGLREVVGGSLPAATWQRFMLRALKGVPVTDFAQPAPLQEFADAAKREARNGFDPGPRRYPTATAAADGFVDALAPPDVSAPTTTTSTTSTTTSTTSTTTTTTKPPPPTLIN